MNQRYAHRRHSHLELPVMLKSTGFSPMPKGYKEQNDGRQRSHCGFFWCDIGSAKLSINSAPFEMGGGDAFYYYMHDAHELEVTSESFEYYWLTFDGQLAEDLLRSFHFPKHPFPAGRPPIRYYIEATDLLLAQNPNKQATRHFSLITDILASAEVNLKQGDAAITNDGQALLHRFEEIVQENFAAPILNLDEVAKQMQLHRTTITRMVKESLGITPSEYIANFRIQQALTLLMTTQLRAAEISTRCGFNDPAYFSRVIQKATGMPPNRFRRQNAL